MLERAVPATARAATQDRRAWRSDMKWLCGTAILLGLLTYVPYAYGWSAGLSLTGGLCLLGWLVLVYTRLRRETAAVLRTLGGLQIIVLLLFLSAYIEDFFPTIGVRDSHLVKESPANAVNLARLAVIGVAGVIAVAAAYLQRPRVARAFRGPLPWMLLYAAVALVSSGHASLPLVSAGKAGEVLADVLCFLILASLLSAWDFLRAWNTIWFLLGLLLVSVWVSAMLHPSLGFSAQPGALFPILSGAVPAIHPNRLGQLGASLAVVGFCRLLRPGSRLFSQSAMLWGGISLFGLITLGASQARTSMIALGLAIPACLYLYRRLTTATLFGLAVLIVLIGAYSMVFVDVSGPGETVGQYLRRGESPELVYSLSGRLDYWAPAWDLFSSAPLFGQGFYTAQRIDLNEVWGGGSRPDLSTVDNTYLEVLLGVGALGFVPLVMALLLFIRRAVRSVRQRLPNPALRDGQKEMIAVFIIALVRSLTGPSFQVHGENLVFLLLMMAFVQALPEGHMARSASAHAASVVSAPEPS